MNHRFSSQQYACSLFLLEEYHSLDMLTSQFQLCAQQVGGTMRTMGTDVHMNTLSLVSQCDVVIVFHVVIIGEIKVWFIFSKRTQEKPLNYEGWRHISKYPMGSYAPYVSDCLHAILCVLLAWPACFYSQQVGWGQLHAGSYI